ncbi:unnamed protein product [Leptosia nina]|uniref:Uncharacterized protein n=1 Tax=Leptosia nina TaxID=320188 RepID=A0AAV1IYM3_9NEOP
MQTIKTIARNSRKSRSRMKPRPRQLRRPSDSANEPMPIARLRPRAFKSRRSPALKGTPLGPLWSLPAPSRCELRGRGRYRFDGREHCARGGIFHADREIARSA